MMTKLRWLNLFLIIFSTTVFTSVMTLMALRKYIKMSDVFSIKINQVPFLVFIGLLLLLISGIVSTFLYYGLRTKQRELVKKIQWLIVGNYTHDVFQQSNDNNGVLSGYLDVVDMQINVLSQKLNGIAQDLNRWATQHQPLALEQKAEIIEHERKRIARELHDSVSQQLYAATMLVSGAKHVTTNEEVVIKQLAAIENIIQSAQKELRALLLHLRPVSLENKSLSQGLKLLLSELETKVSIQVVSHVEVLELPSNTEQELFRITQELISNVLRHAKATKIELYFMHENGKIKLRIVDNGVGFDTAKMPVSSYGLRNIKERVSGMGGQIHIVSVPYQGTSVDITI